MAKRLPGVLHSPGRPGSEGEAPEILMRWWRDLARPGRTWTVSTRLRLWSWSKGQWSVQQAVAPSRVEMFRAPESHNFLGRQGSKPVEKWNCHELPAGISRPLRAARQTNIMQYARCPEELILYIYRYTCERLWKCVNARRDRNGICPHLWWRAVFPRDDVMLLDVHLHSRGEVVPHSDKSVLMVWYGLMVVWVFQILAGYIIYPVMVAAWIQFDML